MNTCVSTRGLLSALNDNRLTAADGKEYTLNHIFQAALDGGVSMDYVVFESGFVHDVGTPGDLFTALLDESDAAKTIMEQRKKG